MVFSCLLISEVVHSASPGLCPFTSGSSLGPRITFSSYLSLRFFLFIYISPKWFCFICIRRSIFLCAFIIIHSLDFFTPALAGGFFTGDWVTASLLKSPACSTVFQFPCNVEVIILLFTFFQFCFVVAGTAKSTILQIFLFFLLITIKYGLLAEIRRSVCMSKLDWSLYVPFSRTGAGLCIYHLFVWSNLNFLYISQWITLPTQSCVVLYSFCANLLHSLIMWLMVSSLSPHSLHLLFCCVLSILALIWLVLTTLSCAAIGRDSVSLLKFPFLSHIQVLLCD